VTPAGPDRYRPRFRPDVEGLRALAVLAVVAVHADARLLPGGYAGVDVFFVISGFLITLLLLGEHARTGRISLARFWGRRIRRLLPMATLTLVATIGLASWILPPATMPDVIASVRAAALFQANWHDISVSTDYFARDQAYDPVLHFWSLSVEEQFYATWPVVMGVLAFAARRLVRRASAHRTFGVVLSLILAASLVLSARLTGSSPILAYFGLRTRAWELAAGALVAFFSDTLRDSVGRQAAAVLATAGLAAIGVSFLAFDATTPFPGTAAVLPVFGTAAIIAAGCSGHVTLVARLLSAAVPRFFGRISYSLYLWHWPLLVFALYAYAPDHGATVGGIRRAIVAAIAVGFAIALAVASQRIVEAPLRRLSWLVRSTSRTLALGVGLIGVTLGCSFYAEDHLATARGGLVAAPPLVAPVSAPPSGTPLRSDPLLARTDWLGPLRRCVAATDANGAVSCRIGARGSSSVVVLLGDSHAAALAPALDALGKRRGFALEVATRNGCPALAGRFATRSGSENVTCERWRAVVIRRIRALRGVGTIVVANAEGEAAHLLTAGGKPGTAATIPGLWAADLRAVLAALAPVAKRLVIVQEPPFGQSDPIECLSLHLDDVTRCSFRRTIRPQADAYLLRAAAPVLAPLGVRYVALQPITCPDAVCPVVTSAGVIMFKDVGHLTASFSISIAGPLGAAVDAAGATPHYW
jgi:peptidoglycan/LPS O-acetylase OafA/YrhL